MNHDPAVAQGPAWSAAGLLTGRKHVLSILVENKPGVLARIAGLFARRGFNIDSLAVGPTDDVGLSRMTIVVQVDTKTLEQVTKQLNKLVNVIKVTELERKGAIRYLTLTPSQRVAIRLALPEIAPSAIAAASARSRSTPRISRATIPTAAQSRRRMSPAAPTSRW